MCKYCEALKPQKVLGVGDLPVGRPFFYNRDEHGVCAHAVIARNVRRGVWTLNFLGRGVGWGIDIDYCPRCGRRLEGEA